jgi:hypothetical protein
MPEINIKVVKVKNEINKRIHHQNNFLKKIRYF